MIICKYVFDNTVEANCIPIFNSGYTYTISDVAAGNLTMRTIESDTLPTLIKFGQIWVNNDTDNANKARCSCLLEVLELNTTNVEDAGAMFRLCNNLTHVCVFSTSNVKKMNAMFEHCQSLVSLDVSNWDTSNVTIMYGLFNRCSSLTSLDLSNWNTGNITNMGSMFSDCPKLTSLDLSSFDTSNVTTMAYMFNNCKSLTSLDLSNFNTSKVTNMTNMFTNCSSLTSLDVSHFDTSKVTNMYGMFYNCSSLTSLDLSNWNIDLSVLATYTSMLVSASALEIINLSYANQDTISVIYNSVPSRVITVKVTPENVAYATDTAPSNVTVIDVIAIMNINTTKQQLIYNILYDIINGKIKPQTIEELLLYSIMMKGDR